MITSSYTQEVDIGRHMNIFHARMSTTQLMEENEQWFAGSVEGRGYITRLSCRANYATWIITIDGADYNFRTWLGEYAKTVNSQTGLDMITEIPFYESFSIKGKNTSTNRPSEQYEVYADYVLY